MICLLHSKQLHYEQTYPSKVYNKNLHLHSKNREVRCWTTDKQWDKNTQAVKFTVWYTGSSDDLLPFKWNNLHKITSQNTITVTSTHIAQFVLPKWVYTEILYRLSTRLLLPRLYFLYYKECKHSYLCPPWMVWFIAVKCRDPPALWFTCMLKSLAQNNYTTAAFKLVP